MTDYLSHCKQPDYPALVRWSDADPEAFNTALLKFIDYRFHRPYERVMDASAGAAHVKWCVGGSTNVVLNCLDRWLEGPSREKTALEWEGEDGRLATYSYADLARETSRLANGLRRLGLGKGEVVFVSDLPKTRNMKIMRRTVRAAYLGTDPGDLSSLVNPAAVEELKTKVQQP